MIQKLYRINSIYQSAIFSKKKLISQFIWLFFYTVIIIVISKNDAFIR